MCYLEIQLIVEGEARPSIQSLQSFATSLQQYRLSSVAHEPDGVETLMNLISHIALM